MCHRWHYSANDSNIIRNAYLNLHRPQIAAMDDNIILSIRYIALYVDIGK